MARMLPLVDRLLDGRLAAELTLRRGRGDSFNGIARWLHDEHDVDVTAETVRQWALDLGIDPVEPAGKAS